MTPPEHRDCAPRCRWPAEVAAAKARDQRRSAVEAVASVALGLAVVLGLALVYASGLARP